MATTKPVPMNDNDEDNFYGASSQVSGNAGAHEFFFVLLQAAVIAHQLHLNTRSIAEHLALDELYKELPGKVDSLIESYQGKYGLVTDYPTHVRLPDTGVPTKLVASLCDYVSQHRAGVAPDSYIQNQIDGIEELLYSTQNKLKFYS